MANKRKYPKKNKRFNISLDPRIWQAAKKQAFKEGISLAYYVVEAITSYTTWLRIADQQAAVIDQLDEANADLQQIKELRLKLQKEEKMKKKVARWRVTMSRKKRRFPGMLRKKRNNQQGTESEGGKT